MKLGKSKHKWEERFDMYTLRNEVSAGITLNFISTERNRVWRRLVSESFNIRKPRQL